MQKRGRMEHIYKEIGVHLKHVRMNKLHVSQTELAQRYGFTSPQYVSNWERGVCLPPPYIMRYLLSKVDAQALATIRAQLAEILINNHWDQYEPVRKRRTNETIGMD